MEVVGWIFFVFALLASVMFHEFGHFWTARRFGMKTPQFFLGFGPTLWSIHRGETEYGIKALPLGGFVRITGMTPLEDAELSATDRERAFYRQRPRHRAIVLGAGSFMHFVLAIVLLLVIAMGLGVAKPTTTIGRIATCVPASATASDCPSGAPASPAAKAGLKSGEKIVAFGGTEVTDWDQLTAAITAHPPGPAQVTVERGGERVTVTADLASVPGRKGSYLGVTPEMHNDRLGPVDAVSYAVGIMGETFAGVGKVIVALPASLPNLFSPDRGSNPEGSASSIVGAADITGQIVAADSSWQAKTATLLYLVVSLNVFVGVFNLLPLLPLDGGHLAVLCWERIRGGIARMRGRPDPGPVDMTKLAPATVVVIAALIGLGVLLVLADIVNPIKL
ncbi:MAG: PDZ domain-containing protein [Streptosporangiales bacterium]|nr:PDZ domain-containing protein [Streptosporangiales bacterium]